MFENFHEIDKCLRRKWFTTQYRLDWLCRSAQPIFHKLESVATMRVLRVCLRKLGTNHPRKIFSDNDKIHKMAMVCTIILTVVATECHFYSWWQPCTCLSHCMHAGQHLLISLPNDGLTRWTESSQSVE